MICIFLNLGSSFHGEHIFLKLGSSYFQLCEYLIVQLGQSYIPI